jgi:hypothetical protein
LLSLEALVAREMGLPWGLSVFAVARRVRPLSVRTNPGPAVAGLAAR